MMKNYVMFWMLVWLVVLSLGEGVSNDGREKERRRKRRRNNNKPHHPRFKSSSSHHQYSNSQRQQHREQQRRRIKWGMGNDGLLFQLNSTRALSLIFPTRQPRHVAEGAANCLKSVLAGLGMSVITFLAMPIYGFREAGYPGLIAGGLTGTLYAALFSVMGLANGAWQMVRGALETPMAVRAARRGLLWDANVERWRRYYLHDEHDELVRTTTRTGSLVKDDMYYKLLDVPISATSGEIKRAYYRQAKSIHPDKNPTEQAANQFRELHAAYLILSDDEKRAAYDQWGPAEKQDNNNNANNANIPWFDPHVFFGILFHSSLMDKYVGALTVASFTEQILQLARVNAPPEDVLQLMLQSGPTSLRARKRLVEVAMNLQERTKEYTVSNRHEFQEACRTEARQIAASGPFGNRYLEAIGSALVLEANQYLGFQNSFVKGVMGILKKNARSYRSSFSIARETLGLFKAMIQMAKQQQQQPDPEMILPQLLDVAWAYNQNDIRKTLQGSCMRLFADAGDDKDRTDRANAILLLGQAFLEVALAQANKANDGAYDDELMSRVVIAYKIASQEGKQDFEDDVEDVIKQHALNQRELDNRKRRTR